ncbi:GNAT family N-acetyltransferase [Nocardioides psychrotolerans]|uniref:GNAT family N-acetyltransferase n=1 Tax=Nocardioides psychrotolerans TaxID=1005945 RepID=UPI0031384844
MTADAGDATDSGHVPSLPALISSERLRLIPISSADAADMLAGRHQDRWHPDYPRRDDVDAATMVKDGDTWGPRHVVLGMLAVGSIGCFGPPVDGETEVGYGLVEAARGRGVATEALRALVAQTDLVGIRLRASVRPDNRASVRVLATCGFTELRGSNEDGELVMARPLPA